MGIKQLEQEWLAVPNRKKHLRSEYLIQWLTMKNIDHSRFNSNTHFQLYKGEQVVDVWPTTNKIRYNNETFSGSVQMLGKLHELFGSN